MKKQQTILVSGAAGNLGQAVVNCFLAANWQVVGLVHKKKEREVLDRYEEYAVNLNDESTTQEVVATILEKYQQIDTVVLTAGGFNFGAIETTTSDQLLSLYQLNFLTAYNLVKPLLAHFKQQTRGKIFFIGSSQGQNTSQGAEVVAYALSKSLLFQLSNIINAENANDRIQSYVVVPTIIDTPQNRTAMPAADFTQWQSPEKIASIIYRYTLNDSTTPDKILEVAKLLHSV